MSTFEKNNFVFNFYLDKRDKKTKCNNEEIINIDGDEIKTEYIKK